MLTTLRIKNLALVNDLTIEFGPGYNVITGETGAGKSILIGALTLVLGERADRTLIRNGSDACTVEAVFDIRRLEAPLSTLLENNGLESSDDFQLVLKRSFTSAGTNRQFVNGSPTTLSVLAQIGEWLVDIHGPHDHQSLLHPARQLSILDSYGKLDGAREEFAALVRRRGKVEGEKSALIVDEQTYLRQIELLRFQSNEISAARLQPGEDQQIEQDHLRASNSAKLLQLSQGALELLAENENSLLTQSGALGRTLQELRKLDASAEAVLQLHAQAASVLRELQTALSHYADQVELDPACLQQLEERLNLLHSLKRKYGPSLEEVMAFGEEAQRKLANLEQRDAELSRINQELQQLDAQLAAAGKALTARRHKVIQPLSKAISQQLAGLGFKQSQFDISLTTMDEAQVAQQTAQAALRGFDTVEFQFAPNPGEPIRPLRAIASSGELARVMLALKTVLAAEDQIPVLVFDEVDANVGGETAHAVGERMNRIARKRQVLCITHLPQVAAPASAHFLATKQVRAGRTVSQIVPLEKGARVTELARMLGGQTEAARKHAEFLLEQA
jgi:DNA repair protein RecN (Recombination protein N)